MQNKNNNNYDFSQVNPSDKQERINVANRSTRSHSHSHSHSHSYAKVFINRSLSGNWDRISFLQKNAQSSGVIVQARSRLVRAILVISFILIAIGGVYRVLSAQDVLEREYHNRFFNNFEVQGLRGNLYDRSNNLLAANAKMFHVNASAYHFKLSYPDAQVRQEKIAELALQLGKEQEEISKKLLTSRQFVYLAKLLSPFQAEKIRTLNIKGINFEEVSQRFYPAGAHAGHVTGHTNFEDIGMQGAEKSFQGYLAPAAGFVRQLSSQDGRVLEALDNKLHKNGNDIFLSLDLRLQMRAMNALAAAVEKHGAIGGSFALMDISTGHILALANVPTYNPNIRSTKNKSGWRNRAVTDVFEPGSTMKPIVSALALERGVISANQTLATKHDFRVGKLLVTDKNIKRDISVEEMIATSSNKGAVLVGMSLEPFDLWQGLRDFGVGNALLMPLAGQSRGVLRDYRKLKPVEHATMSYGHGLSMNLLQLLRAYGVFASGGLLIEPTLDLSQNSAKSNNQRVISEATAKQVVKMMQAVVSDEGTAKAASLLSYKVAGKTGTTNKLVDGAYSDDKVQAIFVGLAPADNPRFVAAVMIDEPAGRVRYGGIVAAPVFREVMREALFYYAVSPSSPSLIDSQAQVILANLTE